MIVEGYFEVKILSEPLILISVKGAKMLCRNIRFESFSGNWIIDGERLLSSQIEPTLTPGGDLVICEICGGNHFQFECPKK